MKKVWFLKVLEISLFVFVTLFFMPNRILAQNISGQYPTIALAPAVGAFVYSGYGSPFRKYNNQFL